MKAGRRGSKRTRFYLDPGLFEADAQAAQEEPSSLLIFSLQVKVYSFDFNQTIDR